MINKSFAALLLGVFIIKAGAFGQCTIPVNTYASEQETFITGLVGASVTNSSNAADASLDTYSTLKSGLAIAGTVYQYLKFANPVAAGTPVTIKLSVPTGLLGALSGVEIQPFTNLHTFNVLGTNYWTADAAGAAAPSATVLNLLNGSSQTDVTITPTVGYDGVWVKLYGVLNVAQSINVYGAYTTSTGSSSNPAVACSVPVDVLSGVRAGTVVGGIANATGSVINPFNVIDTDPTYNTYAELNVGAQVLSDVYLTTIFNAQSQSGDIVRMILQNPGGGLLNLNAITNFTIQLYNGTTPVGTAITSSSGLLSISLLPGTAGNEKYQVDLTPPTGVIFDRADIQVGGLAGVGLVPGLRVYDVEKMIATPATNIDGNAATSKTICEGSTSTFAVNNAQTCTTYNWYTAATGGTLLQTGTSYTPSAASLSTSTSNIYYVEAGRNGCTETSTRTPVTLIVNPAPAITPGANPEICTGITGTSIAYTSALNSPNTYSIVWDSAATTAGFINVADALLPANSIAITVPSSAPASTYNGTLYVKNANGCQSTGKSFNVKVDARATQPVINLTP